LPTIGTCRRPVPSLWRGSASLASLVCGVLGGVAGIWLGVRLSAD
jgi:hypothetical protein